MTDRNEALRILGDIPTAYVRLHVAVTAPRRKRGGGMRVSGGTRDYVPISVEADAEIEVLRLAVLTVHRKVSEAFGEIGHPVGIQQACDDLARWSDMWTHLPAADEFVEQLRKTLARANKLTGHSEEARRLPQTVCPNCLSLGGMFLSDGNGEDDRYGCDKCNTSWSPEGYQSALTNALAAHASAA